MAMVKKSVTVTAQQEAWIQTQMATGNYATDSEIIREAIREKQLRSAEVEAVRAALVEGEKSGVSDRSPAAIKKKVLARKR